MTEEYICEWLQDINNKNFLSGEDSHLTYGIISCLLEYIKKISIILRQAKVWSRVCLKSRSTICPVMAKEVERGKHISVLVEQAFPTCILVSYKDDEGKTFRGVLLHESSHTVTRASISKSVNEDSCSNLCLTAARAVTCESSQPSVPAARVSTRSSRMMSQDQGDTTNLITPVNKIRGLVKTFAPRKRQASKLRDCPETGDSTEQQLPKSPQQKMSLITSLKRKRTSSSTSCKKVKNEEGPSVDPKLSMSRNVIPVLTLTRASGKTNNYVAFLSEKNSNLDKETEEISSNQSTAQDSSSHKHNTRYKVKKHHTSEEREKKSDVSNQECLSLPNGESLVEVYTEQTTTPTSSSVLEANAKGKHSNVNMAYAKRGVQPRNHTQEMRVGDIVWGKVHGHPWWPGRILGVLCHATESDAGFVKVAWYGSTTTSEISCSYLVTFQENFKQLFKKQKQGAYRRAVREAQQDLQVMSPDGQVILG